MSPSETGQHTAPVDDIARQLAATTDELIGEGRSAEVAEEDLRRLMSAAVRLYAARAEATDEEITPVEPDVATTDAVVLTCALLRAEELNPFDLALWFSRGGTGR